MAEHAGLVSFSFGEEGVDRHLVIWKKVSRLFERVSVGLLCMTLPACFAVL